MIDVIQIFKSVKRIEKPDYNLARKQLLDQWELQFFSSTGYLHERTLVLSSAIHMKPCIKTTELVIIQDSTSTLKGIGPFSNEQFYCFPRPAKPSFEIFRTDKSGTGEIQLHLNYSANAGYIGIPTRENHQIAELQKNRPIRYRINGKTDATFSGRRQRTFLEFDYIIEYLGQAERIDVAPANQIEIVKEVPLDKCKLIDERKILK